MGNLGRTAFFGGQWAHKKAPQKGPRLALYNRAYADWCETWRDYLAGSKDYHDLEGEQRRLLDSLWYEWGQGASLHFVARLAAYHALLDVIYQNFQETNAPHEAEAAEYRRLGIQ